MKTVLGIILLVSLVVFKIESFIKPSPKRSFDVSSCKSLKYEVIIACAINKFNLVLEAGNLKKLTSSGSNSMSAPQIGRRQLEEVVSCCEEARVTSAAALLCDRIELLKEKLRDIYKLGAANFESFP